MSNILLGVQVDDGIGNYEEVVWRQLIQPVLDFLLKLDSFVIVLRFLNDEPVDSILNFLLLQFGRKIFMMPGDKDCKWCRYLLISFSFNYLIRKLLLVHEVSFELSFELIVVLMIVDLLLLRILHG